MRIKAATVAIVAVALLIGCSQELSRNKAKRIVEQIVSKAGDAVIPCLGAGTHRIWDASLDCQENVAGEEHCDAIDVGKVFADGLITFDLEGDARVNAEYRVRVTNKGLEFWGMRGYPVTRRKEFGEITGIRKIGETRRVVEYTVRLVPTRFAELYCFDLSHEHCRESSYAGSVTFVQSDDGWKVEKHTAPPFR